MTLIKWISIEIYDIANVTSAYLSLACAIQLPPNHLRGWFVAFTETQSQWLAGFDSALKKNRLHVASSIYTYISLSQYA